MHRKNRRSFLKQLSLGGGAAALGAPLAQAAPAETAMPPLPWPYLALDVETVRKSAHRAYKDVECCAGVFSTIVGALAEEIGHPFDKIPLGMMQYGGGGVAGFASLCGALNGASAAINLVCDKEATNALITELLSWYAATPLPTSESNAYAVNHDYLEDDPYSIDTELPQSIAGGNLCHMSVSNWCEVSKKASGSKDRSERCARLTGDVAAKTVALLNAHFAGAFKAEHPLPADESGCRKCHQKNETSLTRGKMDCRLCHVDPHVPPHADKMSQAILQAPKKL